MKKLLILASLVFLVGCSNVSYLNKKVETNSNPSQEVNVELTKKYKNIIVFIGDGMGPNHVDAGGVYLGKPLCFDVYNKKIKRDGYSITLTMPEHNSVRVIEAHEDKEVVRKMSVTEQFRLMGLEGLKGADREVDIDFINHSYTQLSKRAGNGWDVNLVTILLEHIFSQLKDVDSDMFDI